MVEICSLASGSNGNCYYIGDDNEAVIIDAGIGWRRFSERMKAAGLDVCRVRALFVTHEHRDHSGSAKVISHKLAIPVYTTFGTYNRIYKHHRPVDCRSIAPASVTNVGNNIRVFSFPKQHDAAEPISFRIEIGNHCIGVMTDIGVADDEVCKNFSKCDACFLESNYDPKMLAEGPYETYLKERIASNVGHLSNEQSFALVRDHANPNLTCLILSHISADNNNSEKVLDAFSPVKDKYKIILASRYECGEVVRIG
jgi:phosphoribosyl 1,2-cyclic phosphodiesterase